jgi:hypothetical protein
MGFEPNQKTAKLESVNEFHDHISHGIEEAKSALVKAKDKYKKYYD